MSKNNTIIHVRRVRDIAISANGMWVYSDTEMDRNCDKCNEDGQGATVRSLPEYRTRTIRVR